MEGRKAYACYVKMCMQFKIYVKLDVLQNAYYMQVLN